jgi:hypothetical protein
MEYTVTPVVSETEKDAGLRLTPSSKVVEVTDKPIKDVVYRMMKLNVGGRVGCKDQKECVGQEIELSCSASSFKETFILTKSGEFSFADVLPGLYVLDLKIPNFCWEKNSDSKQFVQVEDLDVLGISMLQSGYSVKYSLSHDLDVKIGLENENKPLESATLKADEDEYCFSKKGRVVIQPQGCMTFEHVNFIYDMTAPEPLVFKPTHFLVKGEIKFTSPE